MLFASTLISLAAVAPIVSAFGPHGTGARVPAKRHLNSVRHWRKRSADPEWIAEGTLTTAEGCSQFYHVQKGDYCYKVADQFGISLQEFYDMNPGIDNECLNLWADYDYCVSRTPQASASVQAEEVANPPTTTQYRTVNAGVDSSTVITADPTATPLTKPAVQANIAKPTPAAAAASTPAPAASTADTSADSDSDDEDCEEWDESDDDTAAPAAQPAAQAASSSSSTQAPAPSSSTAAQSQPSQQSSSDDSSSSSGGNLLSVVLGNLGITAFSGLNTGAIASWFYTDRASDSTNGRSWCELPYKDYTPGFAPSVGTMIKNFGGDQQAAKQAFCGLEATFTAPDGKSTTLFLVDGFDDAWVRTPTSIDVVYDAFAGLFGSTTDNKNNVVQNVSWKFTGKRNPKYVFKGPGDP